jgi:NitT/TauT family transport system ATP-binding protein
MIRLHDISKSFGDQVVLSHIDAFVPDGGVLRLAGPNGVGKSTLLKIVLGLIRADFGTIEGVEGCRLSAVFQENRLAPWLSAISNLRLAVPELSRADAERVLKDVGLELEDMNRTVNELSGGQQRRVALARAVAAPADIVCLDEPFTGIDAASMPTLTAYVADMLQGKDVLLVTHSDSQAEPFHAETLTLGV